MIIARLIELIDWHDFENDHMILTPRSSSHTCSHHWQEDAQIVASATTGKKKKTKKENFNSVQQIASEKMICKDVLIVKDS